MIRFLHALTGYLRVRIIKVFGQPYLERYLLAELPLGLGALYIHRFMSDDPDRGYHNHPWNSLSFVLAGGYEEHRLCSGLDVAVKIRPFHFNRITVERFHKVKLLEREAWSIFWRAGTSHRWGFMTPAEGSFTLTLPDNNLPAAEPVQLWVYSPAREETDEPGFWKTMPRGRDAGREPWSSAR